MQAELEGYIAKLQVEVDQARVAVFSRLALHEADGELADQCGRANSTDALDDGDELASGRRSNALSLRQLFLEKSERCLELFDADRERNDVVGARPHERAH